LKLLDTDLYRPTSTQNLKGESYFMLLIDNYIIMTWVTFLKEKNESFENFKAFKSLVENETNLKVKCLRSDIRGEFTSYEFDELCENHGIDRNFSATRNQQQNGVVERKNITVQKMARTMLNEAKLPKTFWREVVTTTVYILNRA
jgi:hypothetical protein